MKITIAHEFFHAIQRAYLESDGYNSFFFELSSVWIEDVIFPNVNDYMLFGPAAGDYFDNPEINIDQCNGYGLGLYGHYLNYYFLCYLKNQQKFLTLEKYHLKLNF